MSSSRRLARAARSAGRPGHRIVEMPNRSVPVALDTPAEVYAEAVHRAVCEFSNSDGFGHCHLYAIAGYALMLRTMPDLGACCLQAGGLRLCPDPADPATWFGMEASDDGMGRGEFHTWIFFERGVFADFSARHYARYVNDLSAHESTPLRWNRPEPPAYLWGSPPDLPEWVRFRPDREASEEQLRRIQATKVGILRPLTGIVFRHFEQLNGVAKSA